MTNVNLKKKKGRYGTLVLCPVCGVWYGEGNLKKHITQMSQRELARVFGGMLDHVSNEHCFSRRVVLRMMPHYSFRRRHMKNKEVFEI